MKLILFGSGHFGRDAYSYFGDQNIVCFCDNSVPGGEERELFGKKIISFDQFLKIHRDYITIVCMGFHFCVEVCKQLDDAGAGDYLVYDMLKESGEPSKEWIQQFGDKDSLEKLYKRSYRYLARKTGGQLSYLKRHADITTLKPATGQLRQRQMKLLDEADLFFDRLKELDIKPFLNFGNLIGAVRSGGFIPWDDDLDFGLIRTDYERLLEYASKHFVVMTWCGEYWKDSSGNRIEDEKVHLLYPEQYIFNLRPEFLQIGKCTDDGQEYVMDLWVYDFYKNEYDIKNFMTWADEVNEEAARITCRRERAEFIRKKQKDNPMISESATDYIFPGVDNCGGCPGLTEVSEWISADAIFPLQKVKYEDREFWAPRHMEELLKYEYKNFMEFPDDLGIVAHGGKEAE